MGCSGFFQQGTKLQNWKTEFGIVFSEIAVKKVYRFLASYCVFVSIFSMANYLCGPFEPTEPLKNENRKLENRKKNPFEGIYPPLTSRKIQEVIFPGHLGAL
jgi:hypothetical protein